MSLRTDFLSLLLFSETFERFIEFHLMISCFRVYFTTYQRFEREKHRPQRPYRVERDVLDQFYSNTLDKRRRHRSNI
jgi:hypothetical protein